MNASSKLSHATNSATLAEVLERVLDRGIVIAGDIQVKLVDIELLTIQIRLVVCSVDKAIEMGMDWWATNPHLSSQGARQVAPTSGAGNQRPCSVFAGGGPEPMPVSVPAAPGSSAREERIAQLEAELARLRE